MSRQRFASLATPFALAPHTRLRREAFAALSALAANTGWAAGGGKRG